MRFGTISLEFLVMPHDYALVLNAGSSSLKFSVFEQPHDGPWGLATRGQIEGIGTAPRLTAKNADGQTLVDEQPDGPVRDCREALESIVVWLRSRFGRANLLGVGHRVVHGGPHYNSPTVISPTVMEELHRLIPLAPLHQPYNLAAIEAVSERLPHVPQVACFDTSFHRSQPKVADVIPLPQQLCLDGLQRYGFHGLSYEYIASALPQVAPEIAGSRVIVAHLGSGASLCAMKAGQSVDNSLGFTALDGLCMGTRPGSLDPGVVLYLFQNFGMTAAQVENILYRRSGLLGISGISKDMRDLEASQEPSARLAIDYFVYRAAREIGGLAAVLGGIDGLVFTAGIGENSPEIRKRICEASAWLGIELNTEANVSGRSRISTRMSKVSVWVIPTNEELMIARHTALLLGLVPAHS
jgi:acetate kinase